MESKFEARTTTDIDACRALVKAGLNPRAKRQNLFFLHKTSAYMIKKSGFTIGDPEDFPTFMKGKAGLELERFK